MKRWLFDMVVVASVIAFFAVLALWTRSFFATYFLESGRFYSDERAWRLHSNRGELRLGGGIT